MQPLTSDLPPLASIPRHAAVLTAALALLWAAPASAQQQFTGRPQIIDGDTLTIGGRALRLAGLDAPEADQTCTRAGAATPCGDLAAFALAGLVESHWLTCDAATTAALDPLPVVCRLGGPKGIDLGAALVETGWALAVPGDPTYAAQQQTAQAAARGLWAGDFTPPWHWRAR